MALVDTLFIYMLGAWCHYGKNVGIQVTLIGDYRENCSEVATLCLLLLVK